MRRFSIVLTFVFSLPAVLPAQRWEVGGSGGYSFYHDAKVTQGSVAGTTGLGSGAVFGAVIGNDTYRHFGGEIRYTFIQDDLRVASGASKATAKAQSHALHYDVLIHGTARESRVRPFLAAGAGVKYFRGVGIEPAYQPLSSLVVLTHTSQPTPLISVGGGLKISASKHALLRFDVRDYVSPVPDKLLAAPPASTIGGWIHDFVAQFGVSAAF